MSQNTSAKPPLLGRIALQLKMIGQDQLDQLTQTHAEQPDQRVADLLLDLNLVSQVQLAKLEKVQREVIAKARMKQGQTAALPPAESRPRSAAPELASPAGASAPDELPDALSRPAGGIPAAAGPAAAPAPTAAPAAAAPTAAPAAAAPARPRAPRPAPAAVQSDDVIDSLDLELDERPNIDRQGLEDILRDAVKGGASDIHIHVGNPVKFRVGGAMASTGVMPLDAAQSERLALAALNDEERDRLAQTGEIDTCFELPGIGRFRTNVYRQQRGFDAVFRSIAPKPPTLAELNLPDSLKKFTNFHQGMVLLTGPAGCGKSATMAALVNLINEERDEHILTVEDPIEYVHEPKGCLVNQRHAGRHTRTFARALRAALREDPDVIVIGELRDLETISLAMTAAETGHFVLATLHTSNAVRTINRMIGAFPSNRQDQVRTMLSESLRAVVSQRLVNTADGQGRIPALEVLVVNKAIGNLIRDEKTVQIRSSMQTGINQGMCLLEQNLCTLIKENKITLEEAKRYAEDPKLLSGA